jgi:hypothetical protein
MLKRINTLKFYVFTCDLAMVAFVVIGFFSVNRAWDNQAHWNTSGTVIQLIAGMLVSTVPFFTAMALASMSIYFSDESMDLEANLERIKVQVSSAYK